MCTIVHQQIGWFRRKNTFLQRYNLLKVNCEEIENLNREMTSKVSESVIRNLVKKKKKNLGPDSFSSEIFQTPIFSQTL